MKGVILMAAANLKKRLSQSILISITILMAALLLSASLGMLEGIRDPFRQMFDRQRGSHITMLLEGQIHDADSIVRWWEDKKEIEGVNRVTYYKAEEKLIHNGVSKAMGGMLVSEYPSMKLSQDQLHRVEGETKDFPEEGEIWIPTGYAYTWGIEVDDIIEISIEGSRRVFRVGAIVVDPQFSASLMNPVRVWVSNGFLEECIQESENLSTMIGIRFSDYSEYDGLWQDFEDYLQSPYFGYVFDYEFTEGIYSMIQTIISMVILSFSIIIIIVSLFVIGFTVTNGIMTDYRIIGILKAQGFSNGNVRMVYTLQYLLMTALALPLGIVISGPVVRIIMSQMTKSLGLGQFSYSMLLPSIITCTVIIGAVFLASWVTAAKIGNIKPAESIRNTPDIGYTHGKHISATSMGRLPVSMMIAINAAFTGKRKSLFTLASSMILAFVLTFSVNTANSIKNMDKNYAYWGFDNGDVYISINQGNGANTNQDVLDLLQGDDRLEAVLPKSVIVNAAIPAQNRQTSKNVIGYIYDGDMDGVEIMNLEGRNPERDDEVSISYIAANKYEKSIGDRIDLYVEGKKDSYLITGIYQSMSAMGWGIRLQGSAIRNIEGEFHPDTYSVKLKDESETISFIDDMKILLGKGYDIKPAWESGDVNISEITGNIALVMGFLGIVFIVISFIIILNTTLMGIYNDKRNLGVYKSLGMSSGQIRASILYKVLIFSCMGILLGTLLSIMVSPHILSILIKYMGMAKFPFVTTLKGTLTVMPVCILAAIISAWIPSKKVLSIHVKDLVSE